MNIKQILISIFFISILMSTTSIARAEVTYNEKIPVNKIVTNTCNGEDIEFSGTMHLLTSSTDNSAGFKIRMLDNGQNIIGKGLSTGLVYHFIDHFRSNFNLLDPDVVTIHLNNDIISKGSDDNLIAHILIHQTVLPDGTVTSDVKEFTTECRG